MGATPDRASLGVPCPTRPADAVGYPDREAHSREVGNQSKAPAATDGAWLIRGELGLRPGAENVADRLRRDAHQLPGAGAERARTILTRASLATGRVTERKG